MDVNNGLRFAFHGLLNSSIPSRPGRFFSYVCVEVCVCVNPCRICCSLTTVCIPKAQFASYILSGCVYEKPLSTEKVYGLGKGNKVSAEK